MTDMREQIMPYIKAAFLMGFCLGAVAMLILERLF